MTREELEKMFVGKQVKITYTWGEFVKRMHVTVAVCLKIYNTPGSTASFDMELDNGQRHGFNVKTFGDHHIEGDAGQGTRRIEVIQ